MRIINATVSVSGTTYGGQYPYSPLGVRRIAWLGMGEIVSYDHDDAVVRNEVQCRCVSRAQHSSFEQDKCMEAKAASTLGAVTTRRHHTHQSPRTRVGVLMATIKAIPKTTAKKKSLMPYTVKNRPVSQSLRQSAARSVSSRDM